KELGEVIGTEELPDGNLIILTRCGSRQCVGTNQDPLIKITKAGKYIKSWGGGQIIWPHGLFVEKDGSIWTTDAVTGPDVKKDDPRIKGKGHVLIKYSADGKVLKTIGKPGMSGPNNDTFGSPSDLVINDKGEIFVADGHGGEATNERVVKLDK